MLNQKKEYIPQLRLLFIGIYETVLRVLRVFLFCVYELICCLQKQQIFSA